MLALTQVGPTTPIPLLLGVHLVLSTGLAFLFTPAFTTALNPLPPKLYSHGSAILSTLQQVAGAAGVALLVTIMTLRTAGRGRRPAPTRSPPRWPVCTSRSWSRPASGWSPSAWR